MTIELVVNRGGEMGRLDWMVVRAYFPTVCGLLIAAASTWFLTGWQENIYLAALLSSARWLPYGALTFAAIHGSWITYRLWQAERGQGLLCECGGLLGAEQDGRYGRYRRCLACNRNIGSRHYE